jgi:hypothetical protein
VYVFRLHVERAECGGSGHDGIEDAEASRKSG